MSTLIHILSKAGDLYRCAFYYPIDTATYDPSSVDDGRQAVSYKLTQQELDDVKLGHIYEWVIEVKNSGKDEIKLKEDIVKQYEADNDSAIAKYVSTYSGYIDEVWDGTAWG